MLSFVKTMNQKRQFYFKQKLYIYKDRETRGIKMNPFMMSNVFFGPMGMMSMSPMCYGGVNMPYYGSSDMLTFMNFPIFRNTASDRSCACVRFYK